MVVASPMSSTPSDTRRRTYLARRRTTNSRADSTGSCFRESRSSSPVTRIAEHDSASASKKSSPGSRERRGTSTGSSTIVAVRSRSWMNAVASSVATRERSFGYAKARPSSASTALDTTSSNSPPYHLRKISLGRPDGDKSDEIRTFGSRTTRNHLRRRGLVRCCASTASCMAASSSIRFLAQIRSSRSSPRSRRSDSSMTSLSPFPCWAARTRTERRTSRSSVTVVRTFCTSAS